MDRIRWFFIVGLFFVAGNAAASGFSTALEGMDGQKTSLSEYVGKGKWVLFNVWGPKCPPCLEEISELTAFHEDHKGTDAIVVSMALDFPSFGYAKKGQVEEFIEDFFVTYPVLLGDAGLSERVTGRPLRGTPSSYLYDPQGRLVVVQVGSVTQDLIERLITLNEGSKQRTLTYQSGK